MEKFLEHLNKAEKAITSADHIIYVSYPLVREKALILKALSENHIAVLSLINTILQYEYIYKRINLTSNSAQNLGIFINKCSQKYGISDQEIGLILELINIAEKHKHSSQEFIREEKIIILSENLKMEMITIEKIKQFLNLSKSLFKKVREKIGNR